MLYNVIVDHMIDLIAHDILQYSSCQLALYVALYVTDVALSFTRYYTNKKLYKSDRSLFDFVKIQLNRKQ